MVSKKQIEKFRKKECYCPDIAEQKVCEKCNQELPEWETGKCLFCGMLDGLIKFCEENN